MPDRPEGIRGPALPRETMRIDRRELLLTGAAAGLAAAIGPRSSDASPNDITRENQLPGTSDWQLTYVFPNAGNKLRTTLVEGYCSHTSSRAGERLGIFLSANPASDVT